jgi:hypothetical protein
MNSPKSAHLDTKNALDSDFLSRSFPDSNGMAMATRDESGLEGGKYNATKLNPASRPSILDRMDTPAQQPAASRRPRGGDTSQKKF